MAHHLFCWGNVNFGHWQDKARSEDILNSGSENFFPAPLKSASLSQHPYAVQGGPDRTVMVIRAMRLLSAIVALALTTEPARADPSVDEVRRVFAAEALAPLPDSAAEAATAAEA